ncbi:FCD domain-containing protein [Thioclava sp. BHET1]|nr:FCD domain-containing protein [Thioclava sp. BHET1]
MTIARVAGNPLLLTAFQLIDEVRQREDWQAIRDRARTPERLGDYTAQHMALIDAIAAGDAEAARLRMREHLQSLSENLARALAGRDA